MRWLIKQADKFDAWLSSRQSFAWLYLRERLGLLWMILLSCSCGSGAHPRRCWRHPWAYKLHVDEMNNDTLHSAIDDLEDRLEHAENQLKAVESLIGTRD